MKDTIMEQVKPVLDLLTTEQLNQFVIWLDQKELDYDNGTLTHQVLFAELIDFLENNFPDAWSKGFMSLPDEYQLFQGINTPKVRDFFKHPDSTTIARASALSPDDLDNFDFDPSVFDNTPPPPKGGRRKKRTQKMKKMKQNKKNSIRSIYMKRSLTRSRGRSRGKSRSRGRNRTRSRGLKGGYIAKYSTPTSSNKKKKKNKKSITGKTNTSSTQSP